MLNLWAGPRRSPSRSDSAAERARGSRATNEEGVGGVTSPPEPWQLNTHLYMVLASAVWNQFRFYTCRRGDRRPAVQGRSEQQRPPSATEPGGRNEGTRGGQMAPSQEPAESTATEGLRPGLGPARPAAASPRVRERGSSGQVGRRRRACPMAAAEQVTPSNRRRRPVSQGRDLRRLPGGRRRRCLQLPLPIRVPRLPGRRDPLPGDPRDQRLGEHQHDPASSTSTGGLCAAYASTVAWSPGMAKGILVDGQNQASGCGTDDPPLVPGTTAGGLPLCSATPLVTPCSGEQPGVQNIFVRDNTDGSFQLVSSSRAPCQGSRRRMRSTKGALPTSATWCSARTPS